MDGRQQHGPCVERLSACLRNPENGGGEQLARRPPARSALDRQQRQFLALRRRYLRHQRRFRLRKRSLGVQSGHRMVDLGGREASPPTAETQCAQRPEATARREFPLPAMRPAEEQTPPHGPTRQAICGCLAERATTPAATWAIRTIYGSSIHPPGCGHGWRKRDPDQQ